MASMQPEIIDTAVAGQAMNRLKNSLLAADTDQANLSMLKTRIKNLSKCSELFSDAAEPLNAFADGCVREIYEIGKLDESNGKLYRMFGDTLKELDHVRRICMEQMKKLLGIPLKSLSEQKKTKMFPKSCDEVKTSVYAARDHYDQALQKYALVSSQPPSEKVARAEADMIAAQTEFEELNRDYRLQLNQLSSVIKVGLLEQLCMYMYVQHSSFVMGHSLLSTIEPMMRQQLAHIEVIRNRGWDRQMSIRFDRFKTGREKEGYLYLRRAKKSIGHRWVIRWVVVADGRLQWFKKWKALHPKNVIPLEQCSVRPSPEPLSFQVICPRETLHLRVLSPSELTSWMSTIENAISWCLRQNLRNAAAGDSSLSVTRGYHPSSPSPGSSAATDRMRSASDLGGVSPKFSGCLQMGPIQISSDKLSVGDGASILNDLYAASVHNGVCADCQQPDPDWASLSTGALVCIVCAGIHRALPVGFNKAKSLNFDSWEPEQIELLKMIGNKACNDFWEFKLASLTEEGEEEITSMRPTKASSREIKAAWIHSKYILKRFVPPPTLSSPEELAESMFQGVVTENPFSLITLRAYGGDINAVSDDQDQRSLVHFAVLTNNIIILELLIQLGANLRVLDVNRQSPLHYAMAACSQRAAYLLFKRGLLPTEKDASNHSPVDLAYQFHLHWALELFGISDRFSDKPSPLAWKNYRHSVSTPVHSSSPLPVPRTPLSGSDPSLPSSDEADEASVSQSDVSLRPASPSSPSSFSSSSSSSPIVPPSSLKPSLRRRPMMPKKLSSIHSLSLTLPKKWRVSQTLPPLSDSCSALDHPAPPLQNSSSSEGLSQQQQQPPLLRSDSQYADLPLDDDDPRENPDSTQDPPAKPIKPPRPSPRTDSAGKPLLARVRGSVQLKSMAPPKPPRSPRNRAATDFSMTTMPLVVETMSIPLGDPQPIDFITTSLPSPSSSSFSSSSNPTRDPPFSSSPSPPASTGQPSPASSSAPSRTATSPPPPPVPDQPNPKVDQVRSMAARYKLDLPVGLTPSHIVAVAAAAAAAGEIPLLPSSSHSDFVDFVANPDDIWSKSEHFRQYGDHLSESSSFYDELLLDVPYDVPSFPHLAGDDTSRTPPVPPLPARPPKPNYRVPSIPQPFDDSDSPTPEPPKRNRPVLLRELSTIFEEIEL